MTPLELHEFDASQLIKDHPPQLRSRNKQVVFEIACSARPSFEGQVVYSRWAEQQPADDHPVSMASHGARKGFFRFQPTPTGTVTWDMNFADPELFFAYGSGLLAQDELQVAEHPILGSVREALESSGSPLQTIGPAGRPTPVTITGVQRRCIIETAPSEQCPRGLYGNEFARATEQMVREATRPLNPPTISNILAIAAPSCGQGEYSLDQLNYILTAAYSGFRAAKEESNLLAGSQASVRINTGFWGCGAFGGNRTLMTMLQAYAADLAAVDLVFWSPDQAGLETITEALGLRSRLLRKTGSPESFLREVLAMRFVWGHSDGN